MTKDRHLSLESMSVFYLLITESITGAKIEKRTDTYQDRYLFYLLFKSL